MSFVVAANQSTGFGISLDAMSPSGASAYADLILSTAGLQHYYKCDDYSGTTLSDSKGSETLTIAGTNSLTTMGAIAGSPATAFDTTGGSNGVAYNVSHTQIVGSTDFTFEGWVKTSSGSGGLFFFGEGNGASNNATAYVGYVYGKPRMFVRNNAAAGDVTGTGTAFNDGSWHYLAMVGNRSANTINLYVDNLGSQVSMTYPATPFTFNHFSINAIYRTSLGSYSPAVTAHVATYNVALTVTQMQQHYTAGVAAKLAFLRFF